MFAIDLANKTALVTGVADNVGFGWHIAKALANAGADIILSSHPRVISILDRYLTKDKYVDSRRLANGELFTPKDVIPCDVSFDTINDMELKPDEDVSILGLAHKLKDSHIDVLVHSIAFSPEIDRRHILVSRKAYLTALSVSSYSLVSLCRHLLPCMRKASVMAISYLASERVVPFYGGGMASAKAALECDARMLAWELGEHGHRINIISAGPYASRAAKSIGDIDGMVLKTKDNSPLKQAITADDVGNLALFLASDLSLMITGETIHVDGGFHAMALV